MKVLAILWSCILGLVANPLLIHAQSDVFPEVCLIGEHEEAIDRLSFEHEALLLTVCGDNMDIAYEKWMSMLQEMELYADKIGYDIKGLKLWLNVYFNEDGSIRQISYFPKTRSRFVEADELTAFFKSFKKTYHIPLSADMKFAHYGIAHFPTFTNGALKAEK